MRPSVMPKHGEGNDGGLGVHHHATDDDDDDVDGGRAQKQACACFLAQSTSRELSPATGGLYIERRRITLSTRRFFSFQHSSLVSSLA